MPAKIKKFICSSCISCFESRMIIIIPTHRNWGKFSVLEKFDCLGLLLLIYIWILFKWQSTLASATPDCTGALSTIHKFNTMFSLLRYNIWQLYISEKLRKVKEGASEVFKTVSVDISSWHFSAPKKGVDHNRLMLSVFMSFMLERVLHTLIVLLWTRIYYEESIISFVIIRNFQ